MNKAEYLDKSGKGICGRCAAEALLIKTNEDGEWVGLLLNSSPKITCASCERMENEEDGNYE